MMPPAHRDRSTSARKLGVSARLNCCKGKRRTRRAACPAAGKFAIARAAASKRDHDGHDPTLSAASHGAGSTVAAKSKPVGTQRHAFDSQQMSAATMATAGTGSVTRTAAWMPSASHRRFACRPPRPASAPSWHPSRGFRSLRDDREGVAASKAGRRRTRAAKDMPGPPITSRSSSSVRSQVLNPTARRPGQGCEAVYDPAGSSPATRPPRPAPERARARESRSRARLPGDGQNRERHEQGDDDNAAEETGTTDEKRSSATATTRPSGTATVAHWRPVPACSR